MNRNHPKQKESLLKAKKLQRPILEKSRSGAWSRKGQPGGTCRRRGGRTENGEPPRGPGRKARDELRRSLLTDRHARSERGVRTSRPVSSRLPLTVFTTKLQRFKVRQQRPAHDTGISRRPFTLLHRLPVSGPPAQGQRSRPATSITSSAFAPARSVSHSPLPPGFPDGGGS
jgi:hypothetical protein